MDLFKNFFRKKTEEEEFYQQADDFVKPLMKLFDEMVDEISDEHNAIIAYIQDNIYTNGIPMIKMAKLGEDSCDVGIKCEGLIQAIDHMKKEIAEIESRLIQTTRNIKKTCEAKMKEIEEQQSQSQG